MLRAMKEKLERELAELHRELRHELPKEIGKARALGDLRENAEYQMALERQKYVQARIGQLSIRMAELSRINLSAIPVDRVSLGSTVTVIDLATDDKVVYEIVLNDDADVEAGRISVGSPIGRGLSGREVGDTVEIAVPSGRKRFEIVALQTLHDKNDAAGDAGA